MDTFLGQIELTRNQQNLLPTLHGGNVKSFLYVFNDRYLFVTTDVALTEQEKRTLVASITALPLISSQELSERTDFSASPFYRLSPDEAANWIESNVTDLATAKQTMKKIVRVLVYVVRRLNIQ